MESAPTLREATTVTAERGILGMEEDVKVFTLKHSDITDYHEFSSQISTSVREWLIIIVTG